MPTSSASASAYVRRLLVTLRGEVRVVPVGEVAYIEADRSYALVHTHTAPTPYPIRTSLADLDQRLDPGAFCRIHRSTIVRLDAVEAIVTASGGDYSVRLLDGTTLSLSRGRRDTLLRALEGDE
ncbi:MAG: LytTR family DNA-binding domain-containing protein [Bacteroidota bacterium]